MVVLHLRVFNKAGAVDGAAHLLHRAIELITRCSVFFRLHNNLGVRANLPLDGRLPKYLWPISVRQKSICLSPTIFYGAIDLRCD